MLFFVYLHLLCKEVLFLFVVKKVGATLCGRPQADTIRPYKCNKVVFEASRLTVKILSTSVSFAGGQNLETAEAECRICFGDTKAAEASKRNYIA